MQRRKQPEGLEKGDFCKSGSSLKRDTSKTDDGNKWKKVIKNKAQHNDDRSVFTHSIVIISVLAYDDIVPDAVFDHFNIPRGKALAGEIVVLVVCLGCVGRFLVLIAHRDAVVTFCGPRPGVEQNPEIVHVVFR